MDDGGNWVSFALLGASGPLAVHGNVASYDVNEEQLTYTAGNAGLSEALTIPTPASPASLQFQLQVSPGLTPQVSPTGGLNVVDGAGRSVLSFAPPP